MAHESLLRIPCRRIISVRKPCETSRNDALAHLKHFARRVDPAHRGKMRQGRGEPSRLAFGRAPRTGACDQKWRSRPFLSVRREPITLGDTRRASLRGSNLPGMGSLPAGGRDPRLASHNRDPDRGPKEPRWVFRFDKSPRSAATSSSQHLSGRKRYPLVLMLEPLFRCNLACAGCGKIDYPDEILNKRISVEDALTSVDECGAPVVVDRRRRAAAPQGPCRRSSRA